MNKILLTLGIIFGILTISSAWNNILYLRILTIVIFILLNFFAVGLMLLRNRLDAKEVDDE